jgi:hypothetical protein
VGISLQEAIFQYPFEITRIILRNDQKASSNTLILLADDKSSGRLGFQFLVDRRDVGIATIALKRSAAQESHDSLLRCRLGGQRV